MENIQIFNNPEFGELKAIIIEGEYWFIAKAVSEARKENPEMILAYIGIYLGMILMFGFFFTLFYLCRQIGTINLSVVV